jgi:hypothetical protein
MTIGSLFKTTTSVAAPLDGSSAILEGAALERASAAAPATSISDFLTVQSLTNFAVMTGAITAAWKALERLNPTTFSELWVPYAFAGVFGVVSLLISTDALKSGGKWDAGSVVGAIFIAVINALVLASAVVGASVATTATQ